MSNFQIQEALSPLTSMGSAFETSARLFVSRLLKCPLYVFSNRFVYTGGLQTMAREGAKSGPRSHFIRPQRHFVNNEKVINSEKVCDLKECNMTRKKCPVLGLLCDSLWPSDKKIWKSPDYTLH